MFDQMTGLSLFGILKIFKGHSIRNQTQFSRGHERRKTSYRLEKIHLRSIGFNFVSEFRELSFNEIHVLNNDAGLWVLPCIPANNVV
jgi:hypothetical protein